MNENKERINRLTEYIQGLMNREDGKELYLKYKGDLEKVTPQEAFGAFYFVQQKGIKPKDILVVLDKVINVFYKSLISYSWKKPEKGSFIDFLIMENRSLTEKLEEIKETLNEKDFQTRRRGLIPKINELFKFNQHYLKKENILFPILEKKMEKFNGLVIMWSLHDEARALLKEVIECLESENCQEAELNEQIGSLFFAMLGIVKKEELILFPAASEVVEENEWIEMQRQSLEYEFPFIERPEHLHNEQQNTGSDNDINEDFTGGCKFKTETGELNFVSSCNKVLESGWIS